MNNVISLADYRKRLQERKAAALGYDPTNPTSMAAMEIRERLDRFIYGPRTRQRP